MDEEADDLKHWDEKLRIFNVRFLYCQQLIYLD